MTQDKWNNLKKKARELQEQLSDSLIVYVSDFEEFGKTRPENFYKIDKENPPYNLINNILVMEKAKDAKKEVEEEIYFEFNNEEKSFTPESSEEEVQEFFNNLRKIALKTCVEQINLVGF